MGGPAMGGHAMAGHARAGHGARYGRYYGGGGYYEGGAPIYDSCGDGSYGPGYGCPGYGVPLVGGVIDRIFGGYGPPIEGDRRTPHAAIYLRAELQGANLSSMTAA